MEVEPARAEGRMEGSTVADSKGTWRTKRDTGPSQASTLEPHTLWSEPAPLVATDGGGVTSVFPL